MNKLAVIKVARIVHRSLFQRVNRLDENRQRRACWGGLRPSSSTIRSAEKRLLLTACRELIDRLWLKAAYVAW